MNNPLPGFPLIESPLFPGSVDQMGLSEEERRIAVDLHHNGFAVFDFPDPDFDARVARIQHDLGPKYGIDFADPEADKTNAERRIQDAWSYHADVHAIASNAAVIDLLSRLYGRAAFPFQTLNFPVGTQQDAHSDTVHFSSQPERFMCGVWVAMEDVSADAGPLFYYPGSHQWPIMSNALIGRRGYGDHGTPAQDPFAQAWEALSKAYDVQPQTFLARKGQALIWCANLLHGGSLQADPRLTRWSQVTHYYFEDCLYYTPAYSDEVLGRLQLRNLRAISDGQARPNRYLGEPLGVGLNAGALTESVRPARRSLLRRLLRK